MRDLFLEVIDAGETAAKWLVVLVALAGFALLVFDAGFADGQAAAGRLAELERAE
jgi:hypothetical protein